MFKPMLCLSLLFYSSIHGTFKAAKKNPSISIKDRMKTIANNNGNISNDLKGQISNILNDMNILNFQNINELVSNANQSCDEVVDGEKSSLSQQVQSDVTSGNENIKTSLSEKLTEKLKEATVAVESTSLKPISTGDTGLEQAIPSQQPVAAVPQDSKNGDPTWPAETQTTLEEALNTINQSEIETVTKKIDASNKKIQENISGLLNDLKAEISTITSLNASIAFEQIRNLLKRSSIKR